MADDQDQETNKSKPRATLIKKKSDSASESSAGGDKRKVKVVVKRKAKAKAKPAGESLEGAPKAEAASKPESDAPKAARPSAPSESAPKSDASTARESASKPAPAAKTPPPPQSDAGTKPAPKKEEPPEGPVWSAHAPNGTTGNRSRRTVITQRDTRPARGPARGAPGAPRGDSNQRGPGTGRPGAPSRDMRSRGPGAPSGPPRGRGTGAPPPAGGAPPATGGRPAGKKFYKSRKGRPGGYDRDERQRERELTYTRKKPQPKANPVPKEIDIMEVVTVSELARKMNLKANELIGKLMGMGMMVTINQQIDAETAEILAGEYGCKVKIVSLYDETLIESPEESDSEQEARPPIVTVMGHVDHGKTKLLDAIRSTDVVAGEYGGITQHIGAYQVHVEGGTVTFLDTPGHEAFTLMRARGAQVTDIVILVVAANDGVMPQTREAISHAKEAGVPIIVAINKVDLAEANIERVKQQLSEFDLVAEDWGGETSMVPVSALKKEGVSDLIDTILVQAEVMELKASHEARAEGKVIESRIDAGRGIVASVLVQRGTLRVGDSFVAGIFAGKVRAMFDDHGERVDVAGPSRPVEIIGLDGVPDSGDPFQVTEDDKSARQVGAKRQELKRVEEAKNVKKVTLDNLYDSIQDGAVQELKVVIKGDVHGSVEALQSALEKLSTAEIRLTAIHASAGAINEGDIMLASASSAIVVGFHVRPTPRAQQLAEREKVEIRKYSIIYDAVEDIRAAMEGMLAPDLQEQTVGAVEVREVFKVPKIGIVAGCYVTEGKVIRNAHVRVFRDSVQIHEGTIASLKRFKDDVREVDSGYECGIGISNLQDVKVGDTLEIFTIKEVAKKLES